MNFLSCFYKFSSLILIFLSVELISAQTVDIYQNGVFHSSHSDMKTAYDAIPVNAQSEVTAPTILIVQGSVSVGVKNFVWEKSGTATNQITIKSSKGQPMGILNRVSSDIEKRSIMLTLKEVDYVHILGIQFNDGGVGVSLQSADYCSVKSCRFIAGNMDLGSGSATITITSTRPPSEDHLVTEEEKSHFNKIINNYIYFNDPFVNQETYDLYHGIYLGHAGNNTIEYNTIINPPGTAIHTWHGSTTDNTFAYNFSYMCYTNGSEIDSKRHSILLGWKNETPDLAGNKVLNCYINADKWTPYTLSLNYVSHSPYVDGTPGNDFLVHGNMDAYNTYSGNRHFFANDLNDEGEVYEDTVHAYDPLQINYLPSSIANRVVSGDFDGDNINDDIAMFRDLEGSTSEINLLRGDTNKFYYIKNAWNSSPGNYDASKTTHRVVAGDFNGDGKDDMAALYEKYEDGAPKAEIHVWISNGDSFSPNGYAHVWWTPSGNYDAIKVTGRFVSGDVNGDGLDDLIAMYDKVNGTGPKAEIHVWTSNGSSFDPDTYAYTWWTPTGNYDASKVTGRFVSGDFDGDGLDDIAAMYDYGNENSDVHVWTSTGNSFNPSGYAATWWDPSAGYDASKVTSRFVSGDFNGDNLSDIAAMYDYGSSSEIHTLTSDGAAFNPIDYASVWWQQDNYDADMMTGRFVAGNFSGGSNADGVSGFYDYTYNSDYPRLRSHVWVPGQDSFTEVFHSLGFPWMKAPYDCSSYNKKNMIDEEGNSNQETKNKNKERRGKLSSKFMIYPNPNSGSFTLRSFNSYQKARVILYDTKQKEVYSTVISDDKLHIKVEHLSEGMYFLRIQHGDGKYDYRKVIIK